MDSGRDPVDPARWSFRLWCKPRPVDVERHDHAMEGSRINVYGETGVGAIPRGAHVEWFLRNPQGISCDELLLVEIRCRKERCPVWLWPGARPGLHRGLGLGGHDFIGTEHAPRIQKHVSHPGNILLRVVPGNPNLPASRFERLRTLPVPEADPCGFHLCQTSTPYARMFPFGQVAEQLVVGIDSPSIIIQRHGMPRCPDNVPSTVGQQFGTLLPSREA